MAAAAIATAPLDRTHRVDSLGCGDPSLNLWLKRFAFVNQRNDSSKTRVIADEAGNVLAYYSLATGSVEREAAPERIAHGLARHQVPVVVVTRLAVDKRLQGKGIGRALLRDALMMVVEVSDAVAVRAVLIHAKNDAARAWYLRQAEFESLPGMPNKLFLLTKDLRLSGRTDVAH